VRVLELAPELGQGQVLALGQEPGREPGLGREPEPGLGREPEPELGPHKQVGSQLITVPAGLIKFSFSSEKLLHLDFGPLKLNYY